MTLRPLLAGAFLAACVAAPAFAQSDAEPDPAMVAQGETVFTHNCGACHTLDTSKNAFGPSLIDVYEREAGTVPRFAYSDAMRDSTLSWTEDNLRLWITNNEALIPGTRMRHVSITDAATQDYLIAFLKSL
ncbi:MAG: c-type cytochrome [Rhodospirillaceae bacterium]